MMTMQPEQRAARAVAYERARPEILVHVPETAPGAAPRSSGSLPLHYRRRAKGAPQPAHVTGIEIEPDYAAEAARGPRPG